MIAGLLSQAAVRAITDFSRHPPLHPILLVSGAMFTRIGIGLLAVVGLVSGSAWAEPLVKPGPNPSVLIEWRTEGTTIVLTVDDRYDPAEVATALAKNVKDAKTRVSESRVMVTGVPIDTVLKAATSIEVEPLLDDVDAMLKSLQAGAEQEEGTGSSIRARKAMTVTDLLGPQKQRVAATVLAIQRGKFPLVVVTVRVDSAHDDSPVAKGDTLKIVPRVRSRRLRLIRMDPQSKLNMGAWYAQPGDAVEIRLGKQGTKVWSAEAYQRIKP